MSTTSYPFSIGPGEHTVTTLAWEEESYQNDFRIEPKGLYLT